MRESVSCKKKNKRIHLQSVFTANGRVQVVQMHVGADGIICTVEI